MMVKLGVPINHVLYISYISVFSIESEQGDHGSMGGVYIHSCGMQNSIVVSPYYLA